MIFNTESLLNQWKDLPEMTPYYEQICKSWEYFIEKQKEDLDYYMKMYKMID